jgi:hypothetical protein
LRQYAIHLLFLPKDHLLQTIHIETPVRNKESIIGIPRIRSFTNGIHKEKIEDCNTPCNMDCIEIAPHQPHSSKDRDNIPLDHQNWIASLANNTTIIYIDGSKLKDE